MRRLIYVSYHPERRASIPKGAAMFVTNDPIPETYRRLTTLALADGWGLETVVIQDDVRVESWPDADNPLVVYGQSNGKHVCPRAFAATPAIWRSLSWRWTGAGQVCDAWLAVVQRWGTVLNVTTHGGA